MRAGLSTIQQTLTAEAASVLNHSIAEAARRNHGQTTPLHVAATLLASPTGFLRQACIKSHPNSSHPLQCRALELCFSVALERLPTSTATSSSATATSSSSSEPPISNALMAALKRAQAHQRRGCPEQQQQPLLAVKVELEQLIISILDDPSVSRVMREASFSSPAVKATIEQSLSAGAPAVSTTTNPSVGIGIRPGIYVNPRLGNGGQSKMEEVKRVIEILSRGKKRNPVLVGDLEPEIIVKEVFRRIEAGELGDAVVNCAEVLNLEKDLKTVEDRIKKSGDQAVVLNLGDLKWLVDQPGQEAGRVAVDEIGKLLARFCGGDGRLWFIGTATCETYLRCQVYHPSMESDWDLQVVPIAARAPVPGLFPRLGANGILSSSVESLSPLKGYAAAAKLGPPRRTGLSGNSDPSRNVNCCPVCSHGYEQELAKHVAKEPEGNHPPLPLWLQNAKSRDSDQQQQSMDQEMALKQKTRELQKKWSDTCLQLHPSFHNHQHHLHKLGSERMTPTPRTISLPGLYNPALLAHQPFQPKLQMNKTLGVTLQMNSNSNSAPPGSPVRTELVLGQQNGADDQSPHSDRIKDLIGCISSEAPKLASKLDADSFKRLSKGLAEKVWWQPEAAVSVAATMTECRLDPGSGGRKRASKSGDMWVLFLGPDRVGKRKMASALADLISGSSPAVISLGSRRCRENETTGFRGKTVVDKIVKVVRKNPFSIIVLEDISEADAIVRASLKRAMERGRLGDSHGREVSLGNVVFVLTADWLPENLRSKCEPVDEDRLERLAARPWQLRLAVKTLTKRRRFDLNEAAAAEFDDFGSNNSSDLTTIEHEDDCCPPPPPREILEAVDDTIVFKPAEVVAMRNGIASTVSNRFSSEVGEGVALEMDEDALEKILSGLWVGKSSLEEFTENVLVPGFRQLKSSLSKDEPVIIVRLESDGDSERENWLPSSVRVVTL